MSLKDIVQVGKMKGILLPKLSAHLYRVMNENDPERRQDVFHPSEIVDDSFCHREWALRQLHPDMPKKPVSIDAGIKFEFGRGMHRYLQFELGRAGIMWGTWSCTRCRRQWLGFMPPGDGRCDFCHGRYEYWEPPVRDEEAMICGNTDGIVLPDPTSKYLLDIKTVDQRIFDSLVQPLVKNKHQLQLYLCIKERERQEFLKKLAENPEIMKQFEADPDLLEVMRMPFKGGILLYIARNSAKPKEYFVPLDQEAWDYYEEQRKLAIETLSLLKSGQLPERICRSPMLKRAQECPARSVCFK